MPEFKTDKALILSIRPLGERSWIVSLFTPEDGRVNGVFKRKNPPEIGTITAARWRARLAEQLGTFYLEEMTPLFVRYLDDPKRLACLSSLCALLNDTLPEHQSFPNLYQVVFDFLEHLDDSDFLKRYVLFEKDLLSELGFGLDTSCCAGGGDSSDLAYISPKTGRAVSREKGAPFHSRLLVLPPFLWRNAPASDTDIQQGLALTGYFLVQHTPRHRLPQIRARL